ncbi:MAG: B12-binding domain-containing radical SAM protein [Phycisphaerales bacterium]|nr:B12-binding domain-containing radical SAM protein [Phycisphaerales bacterium]
MNIGLFAMSGIRACNTELLELGLTLPGFVERSKTIASLPSLGLLTLAGMTPARHRTQYYEVPDGRALSALPTGLDLAAISSFSAQIDEAYTLARRFRALGVPTVLGGLHVTARPDEAAEHGDVVVTGEGEVTWPQIVADAEHGRLRPRYDAGAVAFDLADAPLPAFELLDLPRYNRLTVQTSRGCPHDCDFCASSILLTRRYKQKPIARVLAEIDRIRALWPRPFIELADDNSFVHRTYWKELLPLLADRGLRWFTETDISVAEDDELLGLMQAAGCVQILIGLESPTEDGLGGIELRNDWKRKRYPRYRDAIRAIQSRGITVNGCFVLGLDGQTTDTFGQVAEFVRDTGLYEVQVTLMTPFPGTPLYARLEQEGRLLEPSNWKKCTLFDINYRPLRMSVEELDAGFKKLVVDLYSDEFTTWRRSNFKRMLRTRGRPHRAPLA